jgi:hypothetical protein
MSDRRATPTAPEPSPAELAALAADVADFLAQLTRDCRTMTCSRIAARAWLVAEALQAQANAAGRAA